MIRNLQILNVLKSTVFLQRKNNISWYMLLENITPGEEAQWIKSLPHKCQDESLDPTSHLIKAAWQAQCFACNTSKMEGRQGIGQNVVQR